MGETSPLCGLRPVTPRMKPQRSPCDGSLFAPPPTPQAPSCFFGGAAGHGHGHGLGGGVGVGGGELLDLCLDIPACPCPPSQPTSPALPHDALLSQLGAMRISGVSSSPQGGGGVRPRTGAMDHPLPSDGRPHTIFAALVRCRERGGGAAASNKKKKKKPVGHGAAKRRPAMRKPGGRKVGACCPQPAAAAAPLAGLRLSVSPRVAAAASSGSPVGGLADASEALQQQHRLSSGGGLSAECSPHHGSPSPAAAPLLLEQQDSFVSCCSTAFGSAASFSLAEMPPGC